MPDPGRLLVAGSIGLDRIWQLGGPLRPGGRLTVLSRRCRIGGAAGNAGAALAALGLAPRLLARVHGDAVGDAMLAALAAAGADISAVERVAGVTQAGDILLGSDGERTLVSGGPKRRAVPPALLDAPFGAALVNIPCLSDPWTLGQAAANGLVVAQMPLDPAEPRPAQVLLASRSDIGTIEARELWRMRLALDGPALSHLVVTAGPRGLEIAGARGVRWVPAAAPVAGDSTGAGDFFAAGLIAALRDGAPIEDAAQAAQATAARFLACRPRPVDAWMPDQV